jgi:glyoxylase-like metal-dependent hydrolase (beta-lactamase superfamily II)
MDARCVRRWAGFLAAVAWASLAVAQQAAEIEIKATDLGGGVHMLRGAGGNLAVLVADEEALLVDSEYAQLADKVLAAVRSLGAPSIRVVINTHWHFDHVGGNERLAAEGALIVAHDTVRERMSSEQVLGAFGRRVPPSPPGALPVLTFGDRLALHWGEEAVHVLHVEPAHTDGDCFVRFRKANVLHLGDVWFNGMYPFIDVNAGGSIDGMIAAVDRALQIADANTKIIPGHGPLGDAATLRAYRAMLATVRERVAKLIKAGKTREQVIAAKPTADLDEKWAKSFRPDMWVGLVYDGMVKQDTHSTDG